MTINIEQVRKLIADMPNPPQWTVTAYKIEKEPPMPTNEQTNVLAWGVTYSPDDPVNPDRIFVREFKAPIDPPTKRIIIDVTDDQRQTLMNVLAAVQTNPQKITRAQRDAIKQIQRYQLTTQEIKVSE